MIRGGINSRVSYKGTSVSTGLGFRVGYLLEILGPVRISRHMTT